MLSKLSKKKQYLLWAAGLFSGIKLAQYIKSRIISCQMSRKGKLKLDARNSKKYEFPPVQPEIQSFILSLSAHDLAKAIKSRQVTSLQAVSTYCQRAYTLGREMNLTAEECFYEALEEAKLCDEETSKGLNRGILHGVPISVKDHISMKGCTSSAGMVYKLDYPDKEDAVEIQLLKNQGAIPFVRSNLTQAVMWLETSNKIYGRSVNPWNHKKTVGGSSGGEGGLISCRASPLGIGSDIGGSIRIPSTFCGIYGFKPTPSRVSCKGIISSQIENVEPFGYIVPETQGPLGRSVDDLILVMKCWFSQNMNFYDPNILPMGFNERVFYEERKLKIGYFNTSKIFEPAPCVKNAINRCAKELSKKYDVVEFQIPNLEEIIKIFFRLFGKVSSVYVPRSFQGEDPEPYYVPMIQESKHPLFSTLMLKVLKRLGLNRLVELSLQDPVTTSEDFISGFRYMQKLVSQAIDKWENEKIDAVICPIMGIVASDHGRTLEIAHSMVFCSSFNVLRFPCGIVPVGLVESKDACYDDSFNDTITQSCNDLMKDGQGLPYSLQIVALPFKDEVALRVMKDVEDIFDFHKYAY
ncbi:hypothetical protein SteCoe_13431 [Stentor coeruleus]|uniref:Amidase domain-containing protein n=1 Tax=Stentor coeruleus TaxID=5963 RepID=A0A1R2C8D2_9CILI|nr:hypothetical protein SteCoe_13431 [Stentor coeruleus]